jgi:hypothetical protein
MQSHETNTEFRNAWNYTSTPPYVFMALCFFKHRDFTFTLNTNDSLGTGRKKGSRDTLAVSAALTGRNLNRFSTEALHCNVSNSAAFLSRLW